MKATASENTKAVRLLTGPTAMLISAIIALTATFIYSRYIDIEQREAARLETIAESHAREISNWLRHRMAETEFIRSSPLMADLYARWSEKKDASSLDRLQQRLVEFRKANEFASAILLDLNAEIVSRESALALGTPPELRAATMRAYATGLAQRTDIYQFAPSKLKDRIDFVIPLTGGSRTATGAAVLRADPAQFLFPLLESWPVPSESGRSVLVRRDGERIVHLNSAEPGTSGPGPAKIDHGQLLAMRATESDALRGGAIKAVDFHGTPVFGAARRVADSDWIVISKINHAEIVNATIKDAIWIGLAGIVLCVAAAALGGYVRTRAALSAAERTRDLQRERLQALQLLDAVTQSSSDAIYAKDRDGRYLMINDEACRATGKSREQVIGRDDSQLFAAEQVEAIRRNDMRVITEGRAIDFEEYVDTESGKTVFHSTKGPLRDATGQIVGMYGIARDITERKRGEQLQFEQNRILELIAAEKPASEILKAIASGMQNLAEDILCSILLTDDNATHLHHGAGPGLPDEYNRAIDGVAIGPGIGSCGTAAHLREEVVVEDIRSHPYWRDFLPLTEAAGLRACWSTPILDANRKLLGTFAVYRRVTGGPTPWHRRLIEAASHLVAIGLANTAARNALRYSEIKYRRMANALSEGVVLFDADGRVLAANPAAERVFGRSEAEMIEMWRRPDATPKPVDESGMPVKYEELAVTRARVSGRPQRNVLHGRPQTDGSIVWYIINAEPIREQEGGPVTAVIASFTDITERFNAAQELRKLSQAVDQSFSSIIITDADARIEYVNEAFTRVTGYSREELLGRNPRMLKSGKTPPETYAAMWSALVRGEAWTGEFVNRRKNGEEFAEIVHLSPIRQASGRITHYLGIREDVTERKRIDVELDRHRHHLEELVAERTQALEKSHAALQESEEFLKTITDNLPGLVSYWDASLRCQFANKSYADWWGVTPAQMIGRTLREILPPEKFDNYASRFTAALNGNPQHFEREHVLPNGNTGYTWTHYIPDVQEGRVVGFYVLASDISGIKQAELRLQVLNEELTAARDKADAANTAKSAFLANMSHEIRTPMNAIIGLTHLLQRDAHNPAQQERLARVSDAAHHLMQVINDILDLSKIEAGKVTLENAEFSLSTLLARAAALVVDRARAKGIEVVLQSDHLPELLNGDATRLTQALLNLLGNAVKFTERGSVTLTAEVLERHEDALLARFSVRDSGIGIPAERLPFLFNAFEQADSSITRRFGGTGLGLAITRHIAALMGGEVGVESTPGAGSTFWFTARLKSSAGSRSGAMAPQFKGQRVLVVDDLPLARLAIAEMLERLGLRAETAASGEEALEKIRMADAADAPYDALLCDWRMSGIDGMEVARRIGAMNLKHPPGRALITAQDTDATWQESRDAGYDSVLIKPVTRASLADCLHSMLHPLSTGAAAASMIEIESALRARSRGARVLLAEDNPVNQEVAIELLGAVGIQPEIAEHGEQALAMAAAGSYDLILMDVQMPRMDGLTAVRELRRLPALQHVPILAMTANAFDDDRASALAAGMNDHISKPVDPRTLYQSLLRWLPLPDANAPALPPAAALPAVPPAAAAALPAGIEGLNTRAGLDNLGGRADSYLRLLLRFADTYREGTTSFDSALAAGDNATAKRYTHSLKGAAGALGAAGLASMAAGLEAKLQSGKSADLQTEAAALAAALAELVAALDAKCVPPAAARNTANVEQVLTQLDELLAAADFKSIVLHASAAAAIEGRLGTAAADLALHIKNCDFINALAVLRAARATAQSA